MLWNRAGGGWFGAVESPAARLAFERRKFSEGTTGAHERTGWGTSLQRGKAGAVAEQAEKMVRGRGLEE